MTADLRHAIRDAVPKLEAIASAQAASHADDWMVGMARSVRADLLSALGDDSGVPGPTTAQEGQEGLSGQISGVSGETEPLPCRCCGEMVRIERLGPHQTFTTNPGGSPHTCDPKALKRMRKETRP